jgi:hypothetical protein
MSNNDKHLSALIREGLEEMKTWLNEEINRVNQTYEMFKPNDEFVILEMTPTLSCGSVSVSVCLYRPLSDLENLHPQPL